MAPTKRKRKTKAKPKDDDDYDSIEETKMEMEEDQSELDIDDPSDVVGMEVEENDKLNEKTIMRVMEKAMTDPEMNSTWKRVIDQEVKKLIKAIQDAVEKDRNPDNVHRGDTSDDSSDDNENQPDHSSRSKRYNRRSSQPRITIRGFNNGKILNPEQLSFRSSLMDFGINHESTEEIMRGGMSNICEITYLNKESIKSFMHGLKSVSPDCPNPNSIHYATPPELKDLTKSREWEEGFCQNLRYRFNSAGFPILYVIRPQEKKEVDDRARSGTVGQNPTDVYPTWSDYNERCGVLSGHQYDEDNNVVWRLLCDATRKGSGWEYEMKESHYTGDAKNYDWNKHKRNWTAFHGTIMRFKKNHNERRFVWDFINSISDERLDAAKADAIDESKDYRDNFNECLILFTNWLGLKKLANGKHKRGSRSVYSVGTSSNKKQKTTGTVTGKLENKPYPTSVYKTMSKEHRQELYQMRQASKKKRALKAAETKKAKEAEKEGAGDSFDFDDGENEAGYCELDSHADTTAAGNNMILLNPDQITTHVDVAPFSEEYKPIKKIPIGSCATAWTSPTSGQVYIIVFHQALYFGNKLKNSLIYPNQIQAWNYTSDPMEDDDPKKVFIKLNMRNVISYFPTRKPTKLELEECEHLIATNDAPWDPHSLKFRMAELVIDNGDPISGDQLSVQAMSTEDASSVVTEPTSNVTDMFSKTSIESKHPNLMQRCKLMRLHQISTRRMLTECQIATDVSRCKYFKRAKEDQFSFDDTEFDFTEALENESKQIPSSQENDNTLERRSLDRRNQWGPSVTTIEGPNKVDCERLAKTWNISFKNAEQTLKVTTQKALRNLQLPLMKRIPTQRFRNKRVAQGTWYTDTWHAKTTSIMRQEKCAQVFTNGNGFEVFIPIQNKLQAHQGLKIFIHEVGIPEHLISDGAPEQGSPRTYKTHWNSIVKRNHIHETFIQPHRPFQNRAEQAICHLGSVIITKTAKKKSPRRLWSFCGEQCANIRQRTASSNPSSMGRTPFELVHGYRPDITLYTSSEWYDFIFWFDKGDSLSHGVERLGRWLGPCGSKVGGGDCFWILTKSAIPISTNSMRPVKEFEWRDCDVLRRMEAIDKSIESKIGDEVKDSASFFQENYPEPPEELFDNQPVRSSDLKLEMAEPEASVEDIDEYDEYLGNEVIIERNDERLRCIKLNPILDTRLYKLQVPDGTIEEYTANIVAESLYSSVDDDGRMFTLLDELIDHECDDTALSDEEATTIAKNGRKSHKPTTRPENPLQQELSELQKNQSGFPIFLSLFFTACGSGGVLAMLKL
eukprot:jgi/Psemu1/3956/gm1.3956_g